MKPLGDLQAAEARALDGLLFDLDDTVLDHGALGEAAYGALFALARAGLSLVAVTGRPAGWGEVLARQWPVQGVVTENGAVALYREGAALRRSEDADEATRRSRRIRLAQAFETLRARFPEARLSDDTSARWSDIAIDVAESHRVPSDVVARMIGVAQELGFRTHLSSVHLHLTLDAHDKASGAVAFLAARYGVDPTRARLRWAFAGDSGNDATCFAAFATTLGVANVREHLGAIPIPPRYVASLPRGAGFAEIAARIVALRG